MTKRVPEIRFEGFTDEWEQSKLGDMVEFFSGLTYSPDNVVEKPGTLVLRSSNVQNGEIVNADNVYVKNEVVNSDNVQVGDIAVVVRNGSKRLIGKHAVIKSPMKDTVVGAFMTGIRSDIPEFTNALLDSKQFEIEIEKNLGATINQITTGNFKKMTFNFPKVDEMLKLGELFNQLDNIIALHQRKLEQLQSIKDGFLQKLFPKDGEKEPEIRFLGFADDWEQRKLGEVAEIVGGGTPSTGISEYWGGDIDWYSPAEIGNQIYVTGSQKKITEFGLQKSSAKILPVGTVLFTSRAGIGNTAILAKQGSTNQGFQSILPRENILDSYFIFSRTNELKKYGEVTGAGSTFVEVSGKQMAQMPIRIPSFDEQRKIGTFFKQLDDTITLHQRELELLKQSKKAFLQKMFV